MIDVTSNEFKEQLRNNYFRGNLIRSGIVQVVDQPLQGSCHQLRYQSWSMDKLDGYSTESAAQRVGDYVCRHLHSAICSIIVGVAGSEPLPEDKLARDAYRIAQNSLCRYALETDNHTIALLPSFIETYLLKFHPTSVSYHLCPFTQRRIASYTGKQLVRDDMCLQPYLFYPGEIKILFHIPKVETETLTNPDGFKHFWECDIAVKGFEYVGPKNPTNDDTAKPESWKRTTEKSRILRVA